MCVLMCSGHISVRIPERTFATQTCGLMSTESTLASMSSTVNIVFLVALSSRDCLWTMWPLLRPRFSNVNAQSFHDAASESKHMVARGGGSGGNAQWEVVVKNVCQTMILDDKRISLRNNYRPSGSECQCMEGPGALGNSI